MVAHGHPTPDAMFPPTVALMTAKQAAEYLALSENMLRKLAYTKEVPHIKLGASLRFLQADLDAYIMRSRIAGKSA